MTSRCHHQATPHHQERCNFPEHLLLPKQQFTPLWLIVFYKPLLDTTTTSNATSSRVLQFSGAFIASRATIYAISVDCFL